MRTRVRSCKNLNANGKVDLLTFTTEMKATSVRKIMFLTASSFRGEDVFIPS